MMTDGIEEEDPKPVTDSITTTISLCADWPIDKTDLLIYESEGTGKLEGHIRAEGTAVDYRGPLGEKKIVAIANSPYQLNLNALDRYDSAGKMEFHYLDDNTDRPFMSGEAFTEAGCSTTISLSPLFSIVELASVSNGLSNYRRLEEPRIILKNVALTANVMKTEEFSPNETFSDTLGLRGRMWEKLPFDVGMYTQNPGTRVYCYPNDRGSTRTSLIFECGIKGETVQYVTDLPPVGRGRTIRLGLEVTEKDKYSWKIY